MSTETEIDRTSRGGFANHVLNDWDNAMDSFFTRVEHKMRALDIEPSEARESLEHGYGYEVAEAWDEWMDES